MVSIILWSTYMVSIWYNEEYTVSTHNEGYMISTHLIKDIWCYYFPYVCGFAVIVMTHHTSLLYLSIFGHGVPGSCNTSVSGGAWFYGNRSPVCGPAPWQETEMQLLKLLGMKVYYQTHYYNMLISMSIIQSGDLMSFCIILVSYFSQ